MTPPSDYLERTYAGVLGKIIGVYLGRPIEGWSYERITEQFGEAGHYIHDKVGVPLVVTDDDIAGTFTFLRALPDYGNSLSLTSQQIGQTWLNYLIERKTVLWWGGLGNSTEHTAYLRLKKGIPAPQSGSVAVNGKIVSEQIGAQIFIDGWAMVSPGNPQQAADLAKRAGSVSHDGEAVFGAQVLAAMEAEAYVNQDINHLLDIGVSFIPKDSIIYRMIADLRNWAIGDEDWRKTRLRIVENYGYEKYVGGCHIVPNHALIILGLLYGEGDFQKSLMICNTSGWDTDCNVGNLGCLMGIRNGLAGFDGKVDWRGPVADRMYIPTADGGRCVTDAVLETYHIVNIGRSMIGLALVQPKNGARYNFELPGSLQGFECQQGAGLAKVNLQNVAGFSQVGTRSLMLELPVLNKDEMGRVSTPTFIRPADLKMPGYELIASPSLYSGQTVHARLSADPNNAKGLALKLFVDVYGPEDTLVSVQGPSETILSGSSQEFTWQVPSTDGPIAQIGFELGTPGKLYLDTLTWDGTPSVIFSRPKKSSIPWPGPQMWRKAWANGVDHWQVWGDCFRLVQNEGRGLITCGTREWTDYRISARLTPTLLKSGGLAARVQGMQRFYSLQFVEGGKVRLLKALDGDTVLAESPFPWQYWKSYAMALEVKGNRLRAWLEGKLLFDIEDSHRPLISGGIALVVEEGQLMTDAIEVGSIKGLQ
jgi:ADP-ribosylglycohydrolase